MRSATAHRDSGPARLLRVVPPAHSTADVVAALVAQNAVLVERIDLLALYIARLDDENVALHAALRDRCDLLAHYPEPLVAQREREADRELRAKPAPTSVPAPLIPPGTPFTRRRIS